MKRIYYSEKPQDIFILGNFIDGYDPLLKVHDDYTIIDLSGQGCQHSLTSMGVVYIFTADEIFDIDDKKITALANANDNNMIGFWIPSFIGEVNLSVTTEYDEIDVADKLVPGENIYYNSCIGDDYVNSVKLDFQENAIFDLHYFSFFRMKKNYQSRMPTALSEEISEDKDKIVLSVGRRMKKHLTEQELISGKMGYVLYNVETKKIEFRETKIS